MFFLYIAHTLTSNLYNVNKARALHKYSFLKLQNNEKNKIDPTLMPLHRKRKKEKETKWGGVGDLKLLKSGHQL